MNSRRSNYSMANNSEYRIDLNPQNNIEELETIGEDILHQVQPATTTTTTTTATRASPTPPPLTNDINNDHLHQLIAFLKDNLTSTFPFALILILKGFYEHSAGILMVIFFSASIYHANTVLVQQAALKSSRRLWPVIRVIIILSLSLILFLYLYRQEKFYLCLIFAQLNYTKWDLWTLLWVLYSTFCIVKMIVMILKSLLIVYPIKSDKNKFCLTYRKRGSYFSFMEYLSQFYISLLTIRPWIHFLLDNNQEKYVFSTILLILYSIIKLFNVYKSLVQLRHSLKEAFQTLPFPSASNNDLRETMCPICQSEYQDPIVLTCKHVFCEECVTSWLDRNASCPLCRCKLPIGQANYRDGFTSGYLIWY